MAGAGGVVLEGGEGGEEEAGGGGLAHAGVRVLGQAVEDAREPVGPVSTGRQGTGRRKADGRRAIHGHLALQRELPAHIPTSTYVHLLQEAPKELAEGPGGFGGTRGDPHDGAHLDEPGARRLQAQAAAHVVREDGEELVHLRVGPVVHHLHHQLHDQQGTGQ